MPTDSDYFAKKFNEADERREKKKEFIASKRESIMNAGAKNSEILSERVKLISLAVLGTCWALLVGSNGAADSRETYAMSEKILLLPILLSITALACDLLQYVSYYFSVNIYLRNTRACSRSEMDSLYQKLKSNQDWKPAESEFLNRFSECMFWLKLISSSAGAIVFAVILFSTLEI